MSFLTPKVKQVAQPTTPTTIASPTDGLNTLARLRRLGGGRNSFAASTASTAGSSTKPNTVTGVNP